MKNCYEIHGLYDNLNKRLEFAMPPNQFANNTPYRLDVIIKNQEIESEHNTAGGANKANTKLKDKTKTLASLYFRTSSYDFVKDKLMAIDQERINPKDLVEYKYVYTNFENFDATEYNQLINFNSNSDEGGTLLSLLDYGLTVSDGGFEIKPYPFVSIGSEDKYVYSLGVPGSYLTEENFTSEEFEFSTRIANGTKLYSILYEAYDWLKPQMEELEIYMLSKGVNILNKGELKSFLGSDYNNYKGLNAPRQPDPRIDIQYILPGGIETFNSLFTGVSLYNEFN